MKSVTVTNPRCEGDALPNNQARFMVGHPFLDVIMYLTRRNACPTKTFAWQMSDTYLRVRRARCLTFLRVCMTHECASYREA
jgi:hypothetical protein